MDYVDDIDDVIEECKKHPMGTQCVGCPYLIPPIKGCHCMVADLFRDEEVLMQPSAPENWTSEMIETIRKLNALRKLGLAKREEGK